MLHDSVSSNLKQAKYTTLKFDSMCKSAQCDLSRQVLTFAAHRVSLKLPPYQYAIELFDIFCTSFEEYHWFLRHSFRERLRDLYDNPTRHCNDRNWLCQVSVVCALAESLRSSYFNIPRMNNTNQIPSGDLSSFHDENLYCAPPGAALFDQGLLLLQISYENPSVTQVQALNLIVSHRAYHRHVSLMIVLGLLLLHP